MTTQQSQPEPARAILDVLDVHVALLDGDGVILLTNRAWNDFAALNPMEDGEIPSHVSIGTNYLGICRKASGSSAENAYAAYRGIKDVLTGKKRQYVLQYACHSPVKQRWFEMKVSPLKGLRPRQVAVVHTNVTALKQAEFEMYRKKQELVHALENLENFAGQLKGALKLDQSIRIPGPGKTLVKNSITKGNRSLEAELLKLLSKREQEVLLALTRGERNADIAARLGINVRSVSTYRSRVLEKLQVKTTAELVSFMHRVGMA